MSTVTNKTRASTVKSSATGQNRVERSKTTVIGHKMPTNHRSTASASSNSNTQNKNADAAIIAVGAVAVAAGLAAGGYIAAKCLRGDDKKKNSQTSNYRETTENDSSTTQDTVFKKFTEKEWDDVYTMYQPLLDISTIESFDISTKPKNIPDSFWSLISVVRGMPENPGDNDISNFIVSTLCYRILIGAEHTQDIHEKITPEQIVEDHILRTITFKTVLDFCLCESIRDSLFHPSKHPLLITNLDDTTTSFSELGLVCHSMFLPNIPNYEMCDKFLECNETISLLACQLLCTIGQTDVGRNKIINDTHILPSLSKRIVKIMENSSDGHILPKKETSRKLLLAGLFIIQYCITEYRQRNFPDQEGLNIQQRNCFPDLICTAVQDIVMVFSDKHYQIQGNMWESNDTLYICCLLTQIVYHGVACCQLNPKTSEFCDGFSPLLCILCDKLQAQAEQLDTPCEVKNLSTKIFEIPERYEEYAQDWQSCHNSLRALLGKLNEQSTGNMTFMRLAGMLR